MPKRVNVLGLNMEEKAILDLIKYSRTLHIKYTKNNITKLMPFGIINVWNVLCVIMRARCSLNHLRKQIDAPRGRVVKCSTMRSL